MATFHDNPTLSFDEWCAKRKIPAERQTAKVRHEWEAYKRLNDQYLMQIGAYKESWDQNDAQQKQIQQEYGRRLIVAVSTNELRQAVVQQLGMGWRPTRNGGTVGYAAGSEVQLSDSGNYSSEIANWTSFFQHVKEKRTEDYRKKIRAAWEKVAAKVIREHNVADANRVVTTWANVIEKAPAFSKSVQESIRQKMAPSSKLVESIKAATGITGEGRLVTPGTGGQVGPGAGTVAATPWGTYALVGLVVVGLAVGAYFMFSE